MEAMASHSTEVDTSDCDEVTESHPLVLRLWEQGNRNVTLKTVSHSMKTLRLVKCLEVICPYVMSAYHGQIISGVFDVKCTRDTTT